MKQPNIILIMTDQQRWDSLGCNGNGFVRTPCVDKLAQEGARFTSSFTPWSLCTPARATMWTGVHAHKHRIMYNAYGIEQVISELSPYTTTVFDILRNNGYRTAYIGKWHLGEVDPGYFDVWDGFNSMEPHWKDGKIGGEFVPDTQTDRFIEYLKTQKDSTAPFIAVNGYYTPHDMVFPPYEMFTAPQQYYEEYRKAGIPFPGYYASVTNIDWNVGRILDALQELELDNTIVVFYSDHGETFRSRNRGHKASCTDDAVRVPFIVRWPGHIAPNTVVNEPVGLEDLMPTILDWAGVKAPEYLDGKSITPLMSGDAAGWREDYYIQNIDYGSNLEQRALRTDTWKIILNQWSLTAMNYQAGNTLYNLKEDPEEDVNLYHDPAYRDVVIKLVKQLNERAQAYSDSVGADLALKALLGIHSKAEHYFHMPGYSAW